MKAVNIQHPLADIQIRPLAVHRVLDLKKFIRHALDDYVEQETLELSDIRAKMKRKHGASFQTPGYYLRVYRIRAGLTQVVLAKKINVHQHHLSEIENNKRSIGKELAKKLASVLKWDYKEFL